MYDLLIIGGCFIAAILFYLVIGKRPRQFYTKVLAKIRWLMSLRLIAKSDLDNLYRQIDVLNEQITMLHTVPIKQDRGGQLQFSNLFEEQPKQRYVKRGPAQSPSDNKWYYEVWRKDDWDKFTTGYLYVERLIKNRKHHLWVSENEKQKGDKELKTYPIRYEEVTA